MPHKYTILNDALMQQAKLLYYRLYGIMEVW